MESEYLKKLQVLFQQYRYVLIYGAGGVTRALLSLLEPYLNKDKTYIVVSDKREEENLIEGYPIKEISEFHGICNEVYVMISAMPRYIQEMEQHLRNVGFTAYCTVEYLLRQLYGEIWKNEIEKRKIIFANGDGYGFGGNPKYIALKLLSHNKNLDLVWITSRKDAEFPEGVRAVQYGTYEHYYELGTAKVWIDNQHKSFFTCKREGQAYIQTWHGGGPLKKIEFDAEGLSASYLDLCEMNSKMEDLILSPSRFNSELYRRAFHYHGEIMECGYPRNDLFWEPDSFKRKVKQLFGIKPEEEIVLFAPTYRNFQIQKEDILNLTKMCQALERRFGRKYRILVRFHPFDTEPEKKYKWNQSWVNVTDYEDVQELLAAADILISDYSSVMWDFSLQMKPVFLFHPDISRYREERGYYLAFEKMPYIEAFSNEDMEKKILHFREDTYRKELSAFLAKYGSFDKGTASEVISDKIMKIIEE